MLIKDQAHAIMYRLYKLFRVTTESITTPLEGFVEFSNAIFYAALYLWSAIT